MGVLSAGDGCLFGASVERDSGYRGFARRGPRSGHRVGNRRESFGACWADRFANQTACQLQEIPLPTAVIEPLSDARATTQLAILSSPFRPSGTILILSSAAYCLQIFRSNMSHGAGRRFTLSIMLRAAQNASHGYLISTAYVGH